MVEKRGDKVADFKMFKTLKLYLDDLLSVLCSHACDYSQHCSAKSELNRHFFHLSQGQFRPLCFYDFLDLGEVEDNVRQARTCKKSRLFIVDPELAKLVVQHLGPDLQSAKTVVLECNPGMCFVSKIKNASNTSKS